VPGAGVVQPEAHPGSASPSIRRVVVGAVEVVGGAAIEVVVERRVVGRSTVEEVVGAAPWSPPEPLLLHPVATSALATTIAASTLLSCPTVSAIPMSTLNPRAGLTNPTRRVGPWRTKTLGADDCEDFFALVIRSRGSGVSTCVSPQAAESGR
jgi:hypothetical protein